MVKTGLLLSSTGKDGWEAMKIAADLGVDGIQIVLTDGEFKYDNMDGAKINEVKTRVREYGLEICACLGDLGGEGFAAPAENKEKVEITKKMIDVCQALECSVMTSHIGVFVGEGIETKKKAAIEALSEIGQYAAARGITYAAETGPEPAEGLLELLTEMGPGVGVNLDPANLVMLAGVDPVKAVKILQKYIVHTHAKDGIKIGQWTTEELLMKMKKGEPIVLGNLMREEPLGQGGVPFPDYLKALKEINYDGYLTIEVERGCDDRIEAIKEDLAYLRSLKL